MEVIVPIFVGLLGAAATIVAAYIQVNRSNIYSATDKRVLNREMTVVITNSAEVPSTAQVSLEEERSTGTATAQSIAIPIQARPAFLDDLGVSPETGELLLFMRRCRFKAGRTDSVWHAGWVVITTRRIVCRTRPRIDDLYDGMWQDGFTRAAGVVISGHLLKFIKVRFQDHRTVLIEGGVFNQLLIHVQTGWFEPAEKVHHVLLATIQVAVANE